MMYSSDLNGTVLENEKKITPPASPSNIPTITEVSQEYKEKIENLKKNKSWMRWIIGGGVVISSIFLASLAASHIINGVIALGVAGVVLVGGYYGLKLIKNYDPVIQKKIQNHALKKLIEEAQEKKIETLTAYVQYLDQYLSYVKHLRNKVEMLQKKYFQKLQETTDEDLKKEYQKLLNNINNNTLAINKLLENSKKKKEDFEKQLKIAKEKYDFIKETRDIVNFLQQSKSLDEMLVDESLNQLEKEFLLLSTDIQNLAKDIDA
jgi:hypothetical protein